MATQKPAFILLHTARCIIEGLVAGVMIAFLLSLIVLLLSNSAAACNTPDIQVTDAITIRSPTETEVTLETLLFSAALTLMIILLLLRGVWWLGLSTFRHARAILAQLLLETAWAGTLQGKKEGSSPWTDTRPVSRLTCVRPWHSPHGPGRGQVEHHLPSAQDIFLAKTIR
jgi:hypothetical protein